MLLDYNLPKGITVQPTTLRERQFITGLMAFANRITLGADVRTASKMHVEIEALHRAAANFHRGYPEL